MSKTLLLLILTLSAVPVASQTLSEIEKTQGKPMLAYSVSEHIWMTPDFAADGQVCRMRFHPKRFYRGNVYLGRHLNFPELKWVLNQIVPPSSRGDRKTSYGLSTFGGGLVETEYEYEKVTFTFIDSMRIEIDVKEVDNYVLLDGFPLTELPKPPPPSESDFDKTINAEIVILRWNDRTCAKDSDAVRPDYRRVAEIEQQFGQPQKVYSVGTYSSMSAEFAADGQVCQMWIYPKRVSGSKSYLGNKLSLAGVWSFLNSFVPPQDHRLKPEVKFMTALPGPAQPDNDAEIVTVRWTQRACVGP